LVVDLSNSARRVGSRQRALLRSVKKCIRFSYSNEDIKQEDPEGISVSLCQVLGPGSCRQGYLPVVTMATDVLPTRSRSRHIRGRERDRRGSTTGIDDVAYCIIMDKISPRSFLAGLPLPARLTILIVLDPTILCYSCLPWDRAIRWRCYLR
jgi:hypothetical protein